MLMNMDSSSLITFKLFLSNLCCILHLKIPKAYLHVTFNMPYVIFNKKGTIMIINQSFRSCSHITNLMIHSQSLSVSTVTSIKALNQLT